MQSVASMDAFPFDSPVLHRLGDSAEAGLLQASVPWPSGAPFAEVSLGGSIPVQLTDRAFQERHCGYDNPLLHRHNWLSGDLFVRLHANGVCEVFARHVNSRYVDDGADLEDVVPVGGMPAAHAPAGTRLPHSVGFTCI